MTIERSATIADLHLRTFTWASRPQLTGDSISAMEYFFDWCLDNKSSAKLLGDIFHTLTPLPEFVKPLFDKLDAMESAGLPVYYIQGNHDLNRVPWMSLHKWPVNVHGKVLTLKETGTTVLAQENTHHGELMDVFSKLPEGVDTLWLHQAEVKAMPFAPEFCLDDVPEQIKTIFIGHIHVAHMYEHGGTTLYYPGSPYVTDIGNTDKRTFLTEELVDGKMVVTKVDIPGRNFYEMEITDDGDLDDAEAAIKDIAVSDPRELGFEPVIRVKYPPSLSERAHQRFIALREELGVYTWLDTLRVDETNEQLGAIRSIEGSPMMDEIITDFVDQEEQRRILTQIYHGEDTGEILRSGLEDALGVPNDSSND